MRKLSDILAEQNRPDDRDLSSRSDARRLRQREEERLARLARSLVALSERKLAALDLPEELLEATLEAKRITSAIARNRQLRIVRRVLRAGDSDAIERRVERLVHPVSHRPVDARDHESTALPETVWLERLASEGDDAIQELVEDHGNADRQRLRQLVRNLKTARPDRVARARDALARAIRDALESP